MIFVKKIRDDGFITKEELRQFLILLNPLAPHISSEIFERVFGGNILDQSWPKYDEKYLVDSTIELPIQINGRFVKTVKVARDVSQEDLLKFLAQNNPELYTESDVLRKVVFVPNKIVNLIK